MNCIPPKRPLPVFALHPASFRWTHCACASHVVPGCHPAAAAGSAKTRAARTIGSTPRMADIGNRRTGVMRGPALAGPRNPSVLAEALAGLEHRLEPADDEAP